MLMPLEAEVETFHASAAAFLRPQSSSLRDHQHPAGRDRPRLFDSERVAQSRVFQRLCGFSFKFVTTLGDLRGEPGFRIVGYLLIPQGVTVTYCSGPRTAPTPPTPLVAQGPRSGPAALPATRVFAASQTGQSALGLAPRRICFPRTSRPRRQELGTGYRIQIREAAPSKPRRGGKAARLESEPCATYSSSGSVKGKLAVGLGSGRGSIRWPGSTTHLFDPDVTGQIAQGLVFQRLCGFSFKFVLLDQPAAVHDRWPECDSGGGADIGGSGTC